MASLLAIFLSLSSGEALDLEIKGSSKTVRGELLRENLKGISLQTPDGPAFYPWTALWKVNGKPAQERLQRLRRSTPAFCPDCRGGLVPRVCAECLGTSTVFAQSRRCEPCGGKGAGIDACPEADCDKGRRACPGRCLKRDAGIWKDAPGVGRARPFFVKTGKGQSATSYLTERHLGQLYEFKEVPPFPLPDCAMCHGADQPCARCRAAGTFVEATPALKGECAECGGPSRGAGQLACGSCHGSGKAPCGECLGAGALPVRESAAACGGCAKGVAPCSTCGDTGLLEPKMKVLPSDVAKALARVDGPLPATDRVTLRDGRTIEGAVLHALPDGIVLLLGSESDLRVLVLLVKHGFRREALAAPPRSDTVVLKDGRTVQGRIVAKSEQLLMLKTLEGETLRIDAARIAEIRPRK